jgi:hypothetical protein
MEGSFTCFMPLRWQHELLISWLPLKGGRPDLST